MRYLESAEVAALAARTVVERKLLWVTAKDRGTGNPVSFGFWNDVMTVTISVLDGRTGATENRDFYGLGPALVFPSVPLTSDITIRSIDIELPQIDTITQSLVRTYDVRGAPMQIYRGYFDPATRVLVASAKPRFVGYVDGAPIVTPKEGGEGSITLKCVSTTRELTRTSSEVRSHESQIARAAGDAFYKDTAVVGDWTLFWGTAGSTVAPTPSSHQFLGHTFGGGVA